MPSACRCWRASSGRLASHLPGFLPGWKADSAHAVYFESSFSGGLPCRWVAMFCAAVMNAARTSSPTSKTAGPMLGPSQATMLASGTFWRIFWTVACRMPPARLRQPAWAAPITLPCRSASSTGRQSATCTARAMPGRVVIWASASGSGTRVSVAGIMSAPADVPWTWVCGSCEGAWRFVPRDASVSGCVSSRSSTRMPWTCFSHEMGWPMMASTRRRFSCAAAGSSPQ